ncbi:hypothetical protein GCM10012285_45590 [Streptomyces kronopolitis]|uniref:DUF6895 domain-containing protein n=2 Tax=Streptomyces kronopolitis TaxID=1612435 RepID=A0ABQ2JPP4_9ACTN|nr:hypothetical protein GCM10012285_45590 [Streptomyces kronopolitis]
MQVLFREGVAGSRQKARAGQLLDFAWRELLDGGNVLARLQHDEPLSPVPLEIYATFHELGRRHPGLEETLAVSRRTTTWTTLEMVPNRRLGVLNAERKLGLAPSSDFDEAMARTWLGQLPEPWTVQLHIAYDITHTVFHLTNWGEAPDRIPPAVAEYLTRYLPAWLEDWADLEHWDLLGELLVVDACLPRPALDAELWERYAAAQSPGGAMPIHHGMPQGDPAQVFDQVHHPTLVAAFASAMATSRAMSAVG